MFISSSDYEKVVTSIAEEKGELLLAVAFWGKGAESIIYPRSNGSLKIICNLKSGGTNPACIEALRNKKGVTLKQHDRLHAKVIVGSKTAVVGSANLSTNGLNLEGEEINGWEEAGFLIRDSSHINKIKDWFKTIWDDSRVIHDRDIQEAKAKWKKRRASRPQISSSSLRGFNLDDFKHADLSDRSVYIAICRGWMSDEAKAIYRKKKKELTGAPASRSAKLPPMYENWPELPKDAQLIDVYYGKRGSLRCYGALMRTHDITFKYKDGSKGHLEICRKENYIMNRPFRSKEASEFINFLKPHMDAIWRSKLAIGDEDGKYIHLADVFKIKLLKSQSSRSLRSG